MKIAYLLSILPLVYCQDPVRQQFDSCVQNCRSSSDFVCIGQCVASFGQTLLPTGVTPSSSASGQGSQSPSGSSSTTVVVVQTSTSMDNSQSSVSSSISSSASSVSSVLSSASSSIKSEASSKLSSLSKSVTGGNTSNQYVNSISAIVFAVPFLSTL
ncbi:hypothetical protein K502DRAFT_326010, partial [Neoconidiobolus thromboides FSU 785]